MSSQAAETAYILGCSANAEQRLALLNELSSDSFEQAMEVVPKQGVKILNVGCGSGFLEAKLDRLFTDSCFIGVDISAQRIEEARARTAVLDSSNCFEFHQADVSSLSLGATKTYDILISRYVLAHLPNPVQQLHRLVALVRPGGYVCLEESASSGSEYYCNVSNFGYETFVDLIKLQSTLQKNDFGSGLELFNALLRSDHQIQERYFSQALLTSAQHKSLIRLGLEDASTVARKQIGDEVFHKMINSLRLLEKDEKAFSLYTRYLTVIAQVARA